VKRRYYRPMPLDVRGVAAGGGGHVGVVHPLALSMYIICMILSIVFYSSIQPIDFKFIAKIQMK